MQLMPNTQQGLALRQMQPAQATGGQARKESLYDTVVYPGAVALASQVKVFDNFGQFNATPANAAITKTEGRDTNLNGNGGIGLPSNHEFEWYQWRHKLLNYAANMALLANLGQTEQNHRLLQLLYCQFRFQQTTHISIPGSELPAGTGPAWGSIAADGASAAVQHVLLGPNCVPDRKGKVITIGGSPYIINALQQFGITNFVAQGAFSPTVDVFSQHVLDGVLTRAIV